MTSNRHIPGTGAAAAHRPELYEELRRRNERRARVAAIIAERRERALRIERVIQTQRTSRFRHRG